MRKSANRFRASHPLMLMLTIALCLLGACGGQGATDSSELSETSSVESKAEELSTLDAREYASEEPLTTFAATSDVGFYLNMAYAGLVALVRDNDGEQGTVMTALLVNHQDHVRRLRIPKSHLPGGMCPTTPRCFTLDETATECIWSLEGVEVRVTSHLVGEANLNLVSSAANKVFPRTPAEAADSSWIASMAKVNSNHRRVRRTEDLVNREKINGYSVIPFDSFSTCRLAAIDGNTFSFNFADSAGGGPPGRQALADVVEASVWVKGTEVKFSLSRGPSCNIQFDVIPTYDGRADVSISNLQPTFMEAVGGGAGHFRDYYELSNIPSGIGDRRAPRLVKPGDSRRIQPECKNNYYDPCTYLTLERETISPCNRTACPVLLMEPF